jgi:4'-phosphopantetheinyl transferase
LKENRTLEPLSAATTVLPAPLRVWSKNRKNRCVADEIPDYWEKHDTFTFLSDVGMYETSLCRCLDKGEKVQVLQFTSDYFKKRFVVSRHLLKSILRYIPGTESQDTIVISRERKGIVIPGRPDLFISLSYSGSCIALTIGKQKIGCDIEMRRSVEIRKIRKSPLFDCFTCRTGTDESLHALQVWTMVEAYAKLRDMNPFPLLNDCGFFEDACFMSYCIDNQAVLSLAWDTGSINNIILWTDNDTFVKKPGEIKPSPHGDLYVRT